MKQALFQVGLFLFLLIVIEIVLRLVGFQPGRLNTQLPIGAKIDSVQRFVGTPEGITVFNKTEGTQPADYVINKQGFRSEYDFDPTFVDSLRKTKAKPVVMFIGDSYTQGCCASPIQNSFVDLVEKESDVIALNFGVGGADLFQYEIIAKKYISSIKPDLVVVPFYLGNDFAQSERPLAVNIPLIYHVNNTIWLNSERPSHLASLHPEPYFDSAKEAYDFYIKHFTLLGENRSTLEKICSKSAILTQLKIGLAMTSKETTGFFSSYEEEKSLKYTRSQLEKIASICSSENVKLIFIPIPSPNDAATQVDLKIQYGKYFEGYNTSFISISMFSPEDYDETQHFKNPAHARYADFVSSEIKPYLESKTAASLAK